MESIATILGELMFIVIGIILSRLSEFVGSIIFKFLKIILKFFRHIKKLEI